MQTFANCHYIRSKSDNNNILDFDVGLCLF